MLIRQGRDVLWRYYNELRFRVLHANHSEAAWMDIIARPDHVYTYLVRGLCRSSWVRIPVRQIAAPLWIHYDGHFGDDDWVRSTACHGFYSGGSALLCALCDYRWKLPDPTHNYWLAQQ